MPLVTVLTLANNGLPTIFLVIDSLESARDMSPTRFELADRSNAREVLRLTYAKSNLPPMDRFVLAAFPTVGLNPLTLRGFLGLRAKPKLHVLELSPSALSCHFRQAGQCDGIASTYCSRSKAWDIAPGKDFPNMLIRFRNLASAPATAFLIVFRFQRSNPETTAFPGAAVTLLDSCDGIELKIQKRETYMADYQYPFTTSHYKHTLMGSPTPYAGPGGSDYRSLAYLGKDRTLSVDPSGNIFSAICWKGYDPLESDLSTEYRWISVVASFQGPTPGSEAS
ncbi:uncharacterized protein BO96DRAFT_380052 [Aspergillus niger CBS 101883]|uniref:Uncharacterized protein n=3 Tax=Aspergillus niger TaxID=5061 RepID=A2QE72_ASPNC|nr:uncharacterized protein BO96DRAFT_380052 [Aspergillus niger CBS 101883]XP_059600060.1 hypothetical protein An02g09640 [Aspergillus niger]PYH61730.1 hypothetical protein BO96DRAFT_380052 [Aspergillus niger CBS 101883]RDH23018.1 hypothetical protein M747DRAFT_313067 [Aspergillus niger ATCC 13496]CAK37833.1 hypothetical protein An02g09640 [Aspergillus niger]